MGQCSFSRQPETELVRPQPAAGSVNGRSKQEQLRKAAAHMQQPYHASSQDELVLLVSLDTITKIM